MIKLYNSMTKSVEPFVPLGGVVTMYVCGITPYETTHLGHIFTYAAADTLLRWLERRGHRVEYVQNLTDIDDPILREANRQKEDWHELGKRWARHYIEDMKNLGVRPPSRYPRATSVIPDIIEVTQRLIDMGVAYESGGNVFFSTGSYPEFGKLSRLPRSEMLSIANERGNNPNDPHKRDPLDFPLWQARQPGEPSWDSPWGPGRPGWHIECSTMAAKWLGHVIDIHGGGADLLFPHHEGEIAQSECSTGEKPFVRYWFHTAMVQHNGRKISKSLKNLVMVRDLLETASPDAMRVYLAAHHYRRPWEHSMTELAEAEELAAKLEAATLAVGGPGDTLDPESYVLSFETAMDEDLDTPAALAILSSLAEAVNACSRSQRNLKPAQRALRELGSLFGLRLGAEQPEPKVIEGWDRHLEQL